MRSLAVLTTVIGASASDDKICNTAFEQDTDYHTGADLGSVEASDENECCQKCGDTADCAFFTFVTTADRGGCWLKKDRGGVRSYSGAISGSVYTTTTTTVPPTTTAAPVTTPIQVFIMMGQSNCVGEGHIAGDSEETLQYAVQNKSLYPYLVDESGNWKARDDVRNVFIMGSGNSGFDRATLQHNEWMTADTNAKPKGSNHRTLGAEFGIGHEIGNYVDAPVMILKSCIGNRALGWDLLPPGGEQFNYTDTSGKVWTYAGYGESPARWEAGTTPVPASWYAGLQYDGDVSLAKEVLADLDTYYPGANAGYEVAGFLWWQGDRDSRDTALAERYEHNLVKLIDQLRVEFSVPKAKFVAASLGQNAKGEKARGWQILDAVLAVDGASGKYPNYAGNVAGVYTHPYSQGSESGSHYGGNAQTYMEIGQAMGSAMVDLLKTSTEITV